MTDQEQALVASVLRAPEFYDDVAPVVMATDFSTPDGTAVWEQVQQVAARGTLDAVQVLAGLPRHVAAVVRDMLRQDPVTVATGESARSLADMVHTAGSTRRLASMTYDVSTALSSGDLEPGEARERLRTCLEDTSPAVMDLPPLSEHLGNALSAMLDSRPRGLLTGWRDIDSCLMGLRRGGLYIIAGRPSMGKTSVALDLAAHVAQGGAHVLYVSIEMTGAELAEKLIRRETEYRGVEHLSEAAGRLDEIPLDLEDRVSSIEAIILQAQRSARRGDLALLVVDYLQLATPVKRLEHREREIAVMSAAFKALAKRLRLPVVLLCQLNRMAEGRKDHRPQLSDLRESGSLEQDADGVLLLFRPAYYDREQDTSELEVSIAKNRYGPVGHARLRADLERSRFEDWE